MSIIDLVEGLKDSVKSANANFREMKDGIENDFDELICDITGKETHSGKEIRSDKAQYGDVICVKKTGYYHFGVYINDSRVIHFAPRGEFDSFHKLSKAFV